MDVHVPRDRLVNPRNFLAVAAAAAVLAGSAGAASGTRSLILWEQDDPSLGRPVALWTTNGDGGDARRVTELPGAPGSAAFYGARLARSGDVIYAIRDLHRSNVADLVLLKQGRRSRLFTVKGLRVFAPSPDGTRIAYGRSLPVAGKPEIVIAKLDGTLTHVVVPDVGSTLSWSSDGRSLFAYGLWSSGCGLCAVSTVTGARRSIVFPYQNMSGRPVFTPSGTRFAFCDLKGPSGERIYTATGRRLRSYVGSCSSDALWSPDETQLLLEEPRLRLLTLRTGASKPFTHTGPANLRPLDWASGGAP